MDQYSLFNKISELSGEELEILCDQVGIDIEHIVAKSKSTPAKSLAISQYAKRKGKIEVFCKALEDWDSQAFKTESLLEKFFQARSCLEDHISNIIGYKFLEGFAIIDKRNVEWDHWNNDDLAIFEDQSEDYYSYTIVSYSAKGEKLFMGSEGDNVYILARPEDKKTNYPSSIFIFSAKKKRNQDVL